MFTWRARRGGRRLPSGVLGKLLHEPAQTTRHGGVTHSVPTRVRNRYAPPMDDHRHNLGCDTCFTIAPAGVLGVSVTEAIKRSNSSGSRKNRQHAAQQAVQGLRSRRPTARSLPAISTGRQPCDAFRGVLGFAGPTGALFLPGTIGPGSPPPLQRAPSPMFSTPDAEYTEGGIAMAPSLATVSADCFHVAADQPGQTPLGSDVPSLSSAPAPDATKPEEAFALPASPSTTSRSSQPSPW